jgi:hypothetical protein
MNTFILAISNLDYHISLSLNKNIMSLLLITIGDLEIIGINALISIFPMKILLTWLIRDCHRT